MYVMVALSLNLFYGQVGKNVFKTEDTLTFMLDMVKDLQLSFNIEH